MKTSEKEKKKKEKEDNLILESMNSRDQEEYDELVSMFGRGITRANRKERTMSSDSTEPMVKQVFDNQRTLNIVTDKLTSMVQEESKKQKTKKKIKRG